MNGVLAAPQSWLVLGKPNHHEGPVPLFSPLERGSSVLTFCTATCQCEKAATGHEGEEAGGQGWVAARDWPFLKATAAGTRRGGTR